MRIPLQGDMMLHCWVSGSWLVEGTSDLVTPQDEGTVFLWNVGKSLNHRCSVVSQKTSAVKSVAVCHFMMTIRL